MAPLVVTLLRLAVVATAPCFSAHKIACYQDQVEMGSGNYPKKKTGESCGKCLATREDNTIKFACAPIEDYLCKKVREGGSKTGCVNQVSWDRINHANETNEKTLIGDACCCSSRSLCSVRFLERLHKTSEDEQRKTLHAQKELTMTATYLVGAWLAVSVIALIYTLFLIGRNVDRPDLYRPDDRNDKKYKTKTRKWVARHMKVAPFLGEPKSKKTFLSFLWQKGSGAENK